MLLRSEDEANEDETTKDEATKYATFEMKHRSSGIKNKKAKDNKVKKGNKKLLLSMQK